MTFNVFKRLHIGVFIVFTIFCLFLTDSNLSQNTYFLAPKSIYKNAIFTGILSRYIGDLNALRSNRDAFFRLKNQFIKEAEYFFPGEISLNTLDEDARYYRCSFLEKNNDGSSITHMYYFDKKGEPVKYIKSPDSSFHKTYLLKKIMNVSNSGKKDYSLDEYIFITDPHGAYYNILKLIAHKFGITYADIVKDAETIEDEIIEKCKYTNYKFNFNGDIPDRAPYTLKTYRLVKRILKEIPGSMYQTGNHDLWAMLNVKGFHLPFYEGYKIKEDVESYVSVKDIPKDYGTFAAEEFTYYGKTYSIAKVNVKKFLDLKRKEYSLASSKTWWADKYRTFMQDTKTDQKIKWTHVKNEVALLFESFYAGMDFKTFISDDSIPEDERRFWGDILGFSFVSRVKVDTGYSSVERMPFSWWQEREDFLNNVLLERYQGESASKILNSLQVIMSQTTLDLQYSLKKKAALNDWSSLVISEGINQGVFESLEWMVADWGFHGADKNEADLRKGSAWGPSAVFERILEVLKEHDAKPPWKEGEFNYYKEYKIKDKNGNVVILPNSVTYLEDKEFTEFGDFLHDEFSIFSKDIYENAYMHAFFPVNIIDRGAAGKEYVPEFTYKGKTYTRRNIFEGMAVIEKDIVNSSSLADLQEPLSLYNSWFAEATTSFKPQHIQDYNKYGISRILDSAAVNVFFSGHNPLAKLGELGIGTNIENRMFCGDNDMSPRYRDMGLYFDIGINQGVGIYGYSYENSKISKNPRISRKDRTKYSGANYHGIGRKPYLESLRWSLGKELNQLFLKSTNLSYFYSHAAARFVKKSA